MISCFVSIETGMGKRAKRKMYISAPVQQTYRIDGYLLPSPPPKIHLHLHRTTVPIRPDAVKTSRVPRPINGCLCIHAIPVLAHVAPASNVPASPRSRGTHLGPTARLESMLHFSGARRRRYPLGYGYLCAWRTEGSGKIDRYDGRERADVAGRRGM
jgi:hypothetical protein